MRQRVVALGAMLLLPYATVTSAEAAETRIEATTTLTMPAATLRTSEDMRQAELTNPAPPHAAAPFRSTVGSAAYAVAKARAAAALRASKGATTSLAPQAAPVLDGVKFTGVKQAQACGTCRPPDTDGAVGDTQYVQIVNQRVVVYGKTPVPATTKLPKLLSVSLASFFGYTAQALFDPRVVYDRLWHRWIMTAEAFAESTTVQRYFLAFSLTSDATGPYWWYSLDVDLDDDNTFWDFPQLGLDQDAVIFTANRFDSGDNFIDAEMFTLAKASVYNGWGFSTPLYTGLAGTLAPPIVLDQNVKTFLVAAQPGDSVLKLYTLRDSSRGWGGEALYGPVDVPVTAYGVPANAPQPGTSDVLDTSDNRFANASTQVGDNLWQVHTISLVGYAAPRYYRIDTSTNTIAQSGNFFKGPNSWDFNPSIAANSSNDVVVTWSATDLSDSTQAQVRVSGKLAAEGSIPAGLSVGGSGTFMNQEGGTTERWGDYSAVSIDPSDSSRAWITNEAINGTGSWITRIAKVKFP